MKLEFEKWIDGQSIPYKAKEFFDEAIICFKVSAYSGAYTLSYLGFQTIIKERLLVSDSPGTNLLPDPARWGEILTKLRKPEDWDREVIELIAMDNSKPEKNIFMINKSIRKEAVYFKEKRNDCVHGKDVISYPQVESLWMFIKNHSGKFVVNGGIEGFVQQVKSHFNPAENDPTADFSELLNRLPSAVHDDQYDELFNRLFATIPMNFRTKDYLKKFWIAIANGDETVREHLLQHLKNDIDKFERFVFAYPEILRYFSNDEPTLRKFWYQYLPMASVYRENVDNLFAITAWLLENKKIPSAEWTDFWDNWIRHETLRWIGEDLSDRFVELLRSYGYFQAYRAHLMRESNAKSNRESWYRHRELLPIYLLNVELDHDFARHFNQALHNMYSGSFTEKISEVFYANGEHVRTSFRELCNQMGITSYFG